MPTFRSAIAQTRSATSLVRDVVLEIGLGGRPPAARPGTGGVPDLGQVPQLDPGVVAPGLVPVVTPVGGDRLQRDPQVRSAGPGGQPPTAVPARRAVLIGGGEGEPRPLPGPAGRVASVGRTGFPAFPVDRGFRFGAAVADGVSLLVGHGYAPGRPGVAGGGAGRSLASHGSIGPIPAISPGRSARSARVISGMVRVIRPANPAGIAPDSDPPGADAAGHPGSSGPFPPPSAGPSCPSAPPCP